MEPRRLQILELIWDRELSVNEIASHLPISVAAVSQHLSKLRAADLVSSRPEGRRRYYSAKKGAMGPLAGVLQSSWGDDQEKQVATPTMTNPPVAILPSPPPPRPYTAPSIDAVEQAGAPNTLDEMASWYRQGLHARIVALEKARKALSEGTEGAASSIRRIARSVTRPAIAERFAEVGATAQTVAEQGDGNIEEGVDRLIGVLRQAGTHEEGDVVKILVVEDSRVEALLHRSIVSGPNREVLMAETAEQAQSVLDAQDVDLILLDLTLPGADGRDLLIELGRRPRTASIPVILLTSRIDAQARTESMALGADAYYAKPVDKAVLTTAVSMMLERSAEARQLGRRDPLSGLRNRAVFLDDVRQLAATSTRARVDVSLAILEIERLGAINDFHGSDIGDALVRSVAERVKTAFRESDLVARWGGAKFAVLFTNTGPENAALALEKLRQSTDSVSVALPDGTKHVATWHAGVSSVGGPAGVDDAVAHATRRLQMARRSGVGRIVTSDAAVTKGVRTVLLIEDDEILADLIEHRLGRADFQVARFDDGAEALAEMARIDASAVVLDTMLPGAEGFEVLRRLKESPSFAGVPVIVLTFGGEQDASRAFKLGASDSLAKPFSVEELVARVSRLVSEFEEGPIR